jgi:hypothetical protein
MANEITYSSISDLRTAEALSAEYLMLLADRNALPNHPALLKIGRGNGLGSSVLKTPELGLMGYDLLTSTGDGSAVANTALTDGSATVTIARYSKSYEPTDLALLTDPSTGFLRPDVFALDAIASQATTLSSLVANVTDDFTATVGSTGVDLTIANFLAAIATLEVAKVVPPYLAILHPVQIGDLRSALSTVGGAIQWMPASAEQMAMLGNGYRGKFMGVDIFASSYVPTKNSGADRGGAMFGRGAVVWADAAPPPAGDSNQLVIGDALLFERSRTAKSGLTAYVSHAYMGVSLGIDAAGVSIITDA